MMLIKDNGSTFAPYESERTSSSTTHNIYQTALFSLESLLEDLKELFFYRFLTEKESKRNGSLIENNF